MPIDPNKARGAKLPDAESGYTKDQVILYARPGALPGNILEDLIDQVKAIDMDQVRAQMAAATEPEDETAPAEEAV